MNFQEWVEKYKPIVAQDGDVIAFETYGKYMDFINEKDIHHIWTLKNAEGETFIVSGKGFIDRLSYFVTEVPWENNEYIPITDEDDTDILYTF